MMKLYLLLYFNLFILIIGLLGLHICFCFKFIFFLHSSNIHTVQSSKGTDKSLSCLDSVLPSYLPAV